MRVQFSIESLLREYWDLCGMAAQANNLKLFKFLRLGRYRQCRYQRGALALLST